MRSPVEGQGLLCAGPTRASPSQLLRRLKPSSRSLDVLLLKDNRTLNFWEFNFLEFDF